MARAFSKDPIEHLPWTWISHFRLRDRNDVQASLCAALDLI
jgi:hypothetical protein